MSLIDNGEAFIKRNAKLMWRKTANSREEMPEYVERSYHEALVNALAHRDYLVNGSEVHIDIYDDRMEIYSPGGMPDGSIIQDIMPIVSVSVSCTSCEDESDAAVNAPTPTSFMIRPSR